MGFDIVEVSRVSKSFNGTKAVDDVSFSVGESEIFGMVGPNGAGKTTTMKLLTGLSSPSGAKPG